MSFSKMRVGAAAMVVAGMTIVPGLWAQSAGVLREVYYNIGGSAVADLTNAPSFPNSPGEEFIATAFEAPSNFADNYGQRMRALLLPPATGQYVFWIAGDDNSVLYLSTDENPARKVKIASVETWTSSREWTKETNQQSAAITLTNGLRYFIEALQKEGGGGDNLAVRWRLPSGTIEEPIPGNRLVPFGLGPPVITAQPTNATAVEGGSATFAVGLARFVSATFQWQRNGTNIPSGTNRSYALGPVSLSDSNSLFRCLIANPYGTTNTSTATLLVTPDVTRPTLTSVANLGDAQLLNVIFSKPVEAASATVAGNYSINNGISVLAAGFGPDTRTVVLSTTPMAAKTLHTLTVNNVRDRATTPNAILPDSQRTFSLDSAPLDISFVRAVPEPIGPSTRHGPVIISEIMYHPTNRVDGKTLEFIELFNSGPYSENLSGYRLTGEVEFIFPSNMVLGARSYIVVAAAPADLQSVHGIANVLGPYTNKLSNSSGTVGLRHRQGAVLFEVNYSSDPPWPAAPDGAGHSLVLARPSLGERDPQAWAASDVMGGSPGIAEPAGANPYRAVVINEFLAHTDLPDFDYIELFNYGSSAVNLSGCVLSDDPVENRFVIPTNTVIQPQDFVYFDQSQLGFALNAAGETLYFKAPNSTRVLDAVRFGAQENGIGTGRYPDGAAGFYRLQTKSPGASNGRQRSADVVINEIMYAPISGDGDDEFVELHNVTAAPIDVGRWRLEDGINYTIPPGIVIPADGYLVLAKNATRLLTNYPGLNGANTLGDFDGNLSNSGERIALAKPDEVVSTNAASQLVTNTIHIVVDEVSYGTGGRWGRWSHEGGSSLELMDPRSDRRLASNWADSDETAKSGWTNIEFTGVLDNGTGNADSLHLILFGPGECLVDNVEVFATGGANLIPNPTFEPGLTGWVPQGNHDDSGLETGQGYAGTRSLQVRAAGRGDTGANRIRTALTSALSSGQTATLRAKVRWQAGNPEILLRLKGNWLEATGNILTARNLGTPGALNSRAKPNAGPAITDVKTSPVLPVASQAVTVIARVHDPDGLAALLLKYRIDPSTNVNLVAMVNNGAGLFSGTIPGQTNGALAAFHIQALDNGSPGAATLFPNDAPARECLVRWGDPVQGGAFGTYRIWMTQATLNRWSTREKLSNKPLDCTFVLGNSRVIYNIGGQYSGSPYHAPGFNSPIGNVCDYLLNFPEDDALLGETDFTLQWPGNGGGDNTYQREQTAYWIGEQIGLPYSYRRHVNLFVNGVRRAQLFEDSQQPNGDMVDEFWPDGQNGDLHKIQLWFEFDNAATSFSANGASLQQFTTTGGQKKLARYRWNFAKRAVQGSASNYTNLFALVDAANFSGLGANYRQQLEATLDVDNWLKTYAVEHIVGNNDSFAYGSGQNMFTYKPAGDTWRLMIWDIDFAFASGSPTNNVFQGIGRSNGIDLGEPEYRRRYWQILQDLANGPLLATRANALLDAKYNAMIAAGRTVDSPDNIKNYIAQRRAYLLGLIATNVPANFSLTLNGGAGFSTNRNLIALTGKAPIDVRSITINGVLSPVTWTSVSNWTALVALGGGNNSLVVQGRDAQGNPIAGASATINVNYTGAVELPQDKLVINEIMYHPLQPDASYVEIFNASTSFAFDVSFWRMEGAGLTFPPGSVIAPGAFAVVAKDRVAFAAAYGRAIPVLGEFSGSLQNGGETLRLIQPGANPAQDLTVDEVRYDSEPPWPAAADGTGASLQLIDPAQDNNRVANWTAVPTNAPPPSPQWRYRTVTATVSSSVLYVYLQSAGEVYIDDLKLVPGTVPEAGVNSIQNGGFESAFPGPWTVSANHAASAISTTIKRSGAASLRVVASSGGTTQGSSIWQTCSPALASGQTCTLSFWYLENTNGGTLTIRLSSSALRADSNIAPSGTTLSARYTPGTTNSVRASLAAFPRLWLNELLPHNLSGAMDRFGHHHPWGELFNGGTTALDLGGFYLANNYSNLTQWAFPSGTVIGPGQFLTMWLDGIPGESMPGELHTSFTIPPQLGSLALVQVSGGKTNILDYFNYAVTQSARSYGSAPEGAMIGRQLFYYTTPGGTNNPAAPPLNVFINEWMADNSTTLTDPADNDFEDWFEIYNPTDFTADLSGFYLGTSLANKTQFLIPNGYTILPHGHLLVWADSEPGQNSTNLADLHTSFKLSKAGEAIGLFASDGTVVDFVSFGPQSANVTEGRFPDGAASAFTLTGPTPRAANFLATTNSPPAVSGIADQTVIEGQLLLLMATATDSEAPPQNLTFSLTPGAPTNATINLASGLFAWRPTPEQAPGTNLITVRATDDGIPPMSGITSFTVRVAPRPRVTSITPDVNGYAITFVTVPGKTYRVEYKNALEDQDWTPLDTDLIAPGETLTVNDNLGSSTQRFFRIVVLD